MTNNYVKHVGEEDIVEYFLYPDLNIYKTDDSLNDLLNKIHTKGNAFFGEYIWHKDEFSVTPSYKNELKLNLNDQNNENIPTESIYKLFFI